MLYIIIGKLLTGITGRRQILEQASQNHLTCIQRTEQRVGMVREHSSESRRYSLLVLKEDGCYSR
jgi:hypothetical protein